MSEQYEQPTFAGLIAAVQAVADAWGEHCKRLSAHFREVGRRWPEDSDAPAEFEGKLVEPIFRTEDGDLVTIDGRILANGNGKAH